MGRGVDISWIGGRYTMNKEVKMPWVGGSIYQGKGGRYTITRGVNMPRLGG